MPNHYLSLFWYIVNWAPGNKLQRHLSKIEKHMQKKIFSNIQYIPRNMHTVFALLCFVVVIHWLIFPYPSGLLHWHCGNLTIAPVPAKQPWWIWINTSCEFIMNDCITTTKQSTTKPCAYFLGYTVWLLRNGSHFSRSQLVNSNYTINGRNVIPVTFSLNTYIITVCSSLDGKSIPKYVQRFNSSILRS